MNHKKKEFKFSNMQTNSAAIRETAGPLQI